MFVKAKLFVCLSAVFSFSVCIFICYLFEAVVSLKSSCSCSSGALFVGAKLVCRCWLVFSGSELSELRVLSLGLGQDITMGELPVKNLSVTLCHCSVLHEVGLRSKIRITLLHLLSSDFGHLARMHTGVRASHACWVVQLRVLAQGVHISS